MATFLRVSFSSFGGLNNHREAISMAAIYAILFNRTLVLPRNLPNSHADPVPIDFMWDVHRLRQLVPVLILGATPRDPREEELDAARAMRSMDEVTATPWCCDVEASDVKSSPVANSNASLLTFKTDAGWGFTIPYFAASLRRLVSSVSNCVRSDLFRCASAITNGLQEQVSRYAVSVVTRKLNYGAATSNEVANLTNRDSEGVLHALHLRLGDKVPCPLMECSECGMETRDLNGFQHRNCDCKKQLRSSPLSPETPIHAQKVVDEMLGIERTWRDARKQRHSDHWQEVSASMIDLIDCGLKHGRLKRGDGIYLAVDKTHDPQAELFASELRDRGFHVFRWADIARPSTTSNVGNFTLGLDLPVSNMWNVGNRELPQRSRSSIPECDAILPETAKSSSRTSIIEQLICARAPGNYLGHFVSSWDELVLHLRASRRRMSRVTSEDGRGQLALFEAKVRVALDGGRPRATPLNPILEGRCKSCNVLQPKPEFYYT